MSMSNRSEANTQMNQLVCLVAGFLLLAAQSALAENSPALQDHEQIRQTATEFLSTQAAGMPGAVEVHIGPVEKRLNLPACASLQAFLPQGGKPWGKITLGVRCNGPAAWLVYLQAQVKVFGDYYVTRGPVSQGQVLGAADLGKLQGDLSALPNGAVTQAEQALGKTMSVSLAAGSILRLDALKVVPAVQQGQTVRVIGSGAGFQVATDGQALNSAGEGQIARARTTSGQTVSGVARAGGVIEVLY